MERDPKETRTEECKGPLKGLRVLDLGLMGAGPFGPSLLADWGAEVVKVELPGLGNILRRVPPLYNGLSLWFPIEGKHKKSIAVDLHTEEGQKLIRELVRHYDVVVENYRPGTLERWNLGYEELRKAREDVILVRVTGFGQEGPYRNRTSYDTVGAAMGGLHHLTGHAGGPPVLVGLVMCDYFSAAFNALACLIAVYHRNRTGRGQWGEVAQYEAIFRLSEWSVAAYDRLGLVRQRSGNRHPSFAPGDLYPTRDGQSIAMMAGDQKSFARLCRAMGKEELFEDPRFATLARRVENAEAIEGIVSRWIADRELPEAMEVLVREGVPASPVYSAREIVEDPHIAARGNLAEVEDPTLGRVKLPNVVPRFSRTPASIRDTGAALGEHTEEILSRIYAGPREMEGRGAEEQGRISPSAPLPPCSPAPLPLEGLRVLEVGCSLAGSFAAVLLADFGAEVLKVEEPGVGDLLRQLPPFDQGVSLWWAVEARNKKSLTLDLRRTPGRSIFQRLAAASDVVVESFRPGTLERWGLGYERLCEDHPGLVLLRISGFGQSGPYRDRPSYEAVASAMGGLTYLCGFPDEPPVRPGLALSDYLAGTFGALGILAALYHRDRSGEGQWIDLALYEPLIRFSHQNIPAFDKLGEIKGRTGNRSHPRGMGVAPAGLFETRDGRWVVALAPEDKDFGRLCRAMRKEELASDPRFASLLRRAENLEEINEIIARWAKGCTAEEAMAALAQEQVPCTLVYNIADAFEDPHYRARGSIVEVQDPAMGAVRMQGVVPWLSQTPGRVTSAGPLLGQHNQEIYGGMLGLSSKELAELKEEGVV